MLIAVLWFGSRQGVLQAPMIWAGLIFVFGSAAIVSGTLQWLQRVDHHALLRSEEKLQNKDALVIGAFFTLLLLLAYCVTGAAAAMQFPGRGGGAVLLALTWALASVSVGGAFGFLLGHPRRLADEKPERAGMSGLLRTGLDDMVDWLVKGLTTVLLVQATAILQHLQIVSQQMARGLLGADATELQVTAAAAFAQPVIVCFTILGALATCLVTRTYLTGALGRADRTTTGAFSRVGLDWGEVLLLVSAQRSLTARDLQPGPEVLQVAEKLSALSLKDLHSVQEFAMWAKAKSMLGHTEEALKGYEKAVAECDCDPVLLLDYAVVLHAADKRSDALARLNLAYDHLSAATPLETRRNVYKSLTFELLYQPASFDRVIELASEYEEQRSKNQAPRSGGLLVNEACAWGQKFLWKAQQKGLIERVTNKPIKVNIPGHPSDWPPEHEDLTEAYDNALAAVTKAVEHDAGWKKHFRLLLQSSHPGRAANPDMNDLEIFERFDEFRFAVDLPPFDEAQKPADPGSIAADTGAVHAGSGDGGLRKEQSQSETFGTNVSTEPSDVTKPSTGETT
jgi:hypothetical protein